MVLTGLAILAVALLVGSALLYTPDKSRAALEAAYLERPAHMIDVAGTRLHVRDTGPRAGPTVILLHGFGAHLQTWDGWAVELEKKHRTIRFDMPGAGLSPPDITGDYSDARALILLNALMTQLGVERASLIGNSLGGRIAWTFAAMHPDRVDKLILVSPDGFASLGFEYGKPPNVPAILNVMKYTLPKWMLKSNLAVAYSDPAKLSAETLQRYHDLMLAPGARAALIERMKQTVLAKPQPLLTKITAPVLLVWGEDDAMIPRANAADYQAILPGATLVTLPGVGHLPQEEAPAETAPIILDFLDAE